MTLSGHEILNEFRVVVFGVPSPSGNLLFNEFDYRLKFWRSPAYFSGAVPEFQLDIGDPVGLQLVSTGPNTIVPDEPFGNAGVFGDNADTYDFRFDLTSVPAGGPSQQILESPLAAGDWVIAFQSRHLADESGFLRVASSGEAVGPVPLFSRDEDTPRGILGGQDPGNIVIRWGIAATAEIPIQGDFTHDGSVNINDLAVWQSSLGSDDSADADSDGDSDGADFFSVATGAQDEPTII